jgi:hypothetical protein
MLMAKKIGQKKQIFFQIPQISRLFPTDVTFRKPDAKTNTTQKSSFRSLALLQPNASSHAFHVDNFTAQVTWLRCAGGEFASALPGRTVCQMTVNLGRARSSAKHLGHPAALPERALTVYTPEDARRQPGACSSSHFTAPQNNPLTGLPPETLDAPGRRYD